MKCACFLRAGAGVVVGGVDVGPAAKTTATISLFCSRRPPDGRRAAGDWRRAPIKSLPYSAALGLVAVGAEINHPAAAAAKVATTTTTSSAAGRYQFASN